MSEPRERLTWSHILPCVLAALASAAVTALAFVAYGHFQERPPEPVGLRITLTELPKIELDSPAAPALPYRQKYTFEARDWFTYNIPIWEKAFASFKGKPDLRYLEVGAYEGRSAIWMLENVLTGPGTTLTVIDIFSEDAVKDRFLANVKLAGAADKLKLMVGPSQVELRKLPVNSFDLIYIDGSHVAADVLEDCLLSWRLLKSHGLLIFDDYQWGVDAADEQKPKIAIDMFMHLIGLKHFDVVHNGFQLILRRKDPLPFSSLDAARCRRCFAT